MAATEAEIRDGLAWETSTKQAEEKSTWEWLWEAIQGDFSDNRSTGQIAFDAAISMVPVVDQICDIRDIIANCRGIAQSKESDDNTWKYVALALTLTGLIPTLGSLLKGVLKIAFTFVRRLGLDHIEKAVDLSMTWIITFLRKREVQQYLKAQKVDHVFKWLAQGVRAIQPKVTSTALLKAFDDGIGTLKRLLEKVTWLPKVGDKARNAIAMVEKVRAAAPQPLKKVDELLQRILNAIAHRFEMEDLMLRHGILDARNIHFRGALPEARAVTLMRQAEPPPAWLSKGKAGSWAEQKLTDGKRVVEMQRKIDPDYPALSDKNITSFHKMTPVEINGPTKIYRVTSPSNGAMGDCWVPEDVWNKIMASPDPKAAWRKYLAVWPDWNPNGQFVVLEIPAGQSVKAWRGPAASQVKKDLPDRNLEGGWDQIIIKVGGDEYDTVRMYKRGGAQGNQLRRTDMTYADYRALPDKDPRKAEYLPVREAINQANVKGPLDTGWGMTDFDAQLRDVKIGLPTLPGQVTN